MYIHIAQLYFFRIIDDNIIFFATHECNSWGTNGHFKIAYM